VDETREEAVPVDEYALAEFASRVDAMLLKTP
jgi:hypothetical protein